MMIQAQRQAFISAAEAGNPLDTPAGSLTLVATEERTGGALTAFETIAPPGAGPPFHVHVREDELIYVLAGRLRIRLEDDIHEAPVGSFAFIPRGLPHTWQTISETPARILVAFTPAAPGMERFFARSAELPADSRMADAFGNFANDAGMEVLGPPLAQSHPRP